MDDMEDITHLFNKTCGVYVLYQQGTIVYIGKSLNLVHRVHQHKRDLRFTFDKVLVRYCQPHQLDSIEIGLIRIHRPTFNRVAYVAKDGVNRSAELIELMRNRRKTVD